MDGVGVAVVDGGGRHQGLLAPPNLKRNRKDYERLTGQKLLPAIEFEDGTILREESDELVARISEGRLTAL